MFGRKRNRGLSINDFKTTQIRSQPKPEPVIKEFKPDPVIKEFKPAPSNDVDEDKPSPESSKQEDTPVRVIKQINKERKEAKKQRGEDTMSFEGIKAKFLLNRNKAGFIRKHKNIIKKLNKQDQKKFIILAKEHFN